MHQKQDPLNSRPEIAAENNDNIKKGSQNMILFQLEEIVIWLLVRDKIVT